MLELIPKDSTVLERGAYLFELAPDGVNVKLKKAGHRLDARDLINMGDWLVEIACETQEAKKTARVFDQEGHLMPDKLLDVIRWQVRRGMTNGQIAKQLEVDEWSLSRAIDAAHSNGQWKAAENILIRKGVIPNPSKPLKPRIATFE